MEAEIEKLTAYRMTDWNACADVWIVTDRGGMSRYRIEPYNTCVDWWIILDEQDDIVFGGTHRQCEDWLDREENHAS